MGKNKFAFTQTKTFQKIVALLLAIICWFLVVTTTGSSITETIKNIPVNIQSHEAALSQIGLSIIDIDTQSVSAVVKGERMVIGRLTPEDLTATLQINASSSEQGVYELRVIPSTNVSSNLGGVQKDYTIERYEPETIKVKLDRIESKTFPLDAEIRGTISAGKGFIQDESETLTPDVITVSGPQAEINRIDKCVVRLEEDRVLEKNLAIELPVLLLDPQGEIIDQEAHHLTIDNSQVQFVISVLKEKELPLGVEFLNIPRNFPIDEFANESTMSNYSVAVAGPVDVVGKHKELLLGFVDFSEIGLDKYSFIFDVKLPSGFTNIDKVQSVTVTFPVENWEEEYFTIEDIRILNAPSGIEIQIISQQIPNVHMVGNGSIMEDLSVTDLVAEIDLADKKDISLGQYKYPVKISAPTKGMVWANGEYHVVISVTQP